MNTNHSELISQTLSDTEKVVGIFGYNFRTLEGVVDYVTK